MIWHIRTTIYVTSWSFFQKSGKSSSKLTDAYIYTFHYNLWTFTFMYFIEYKFQSFSVKCHRLLSIHNNFGGKVDEKYCRFLYHVWYFYHLTINKSSPQR